MDGILVCVVTRLLANCAALPLEPTVVQPAEVASALTEDYQKCQ